VPDIKDFPTLPKVKLRPALVPVPLLGTKPKDPVPSPPQAGVANLR
jgi:hypothetical protein